MGWGEEKKISNPDEATIGDAIRVLRLKNKNLERWNQEFGHNVFTDEEIEKLAEYARFLIASRRKEDPVFPPSLPLLDNKHAVIFK